MSRLLIRNQVADFEQWKRVLDLHALALGDAGMKLRHVWRDLDAPDEVILLFDVESVARAREFLTAPQSVDSSSAAGILDGEYRFLKDTPGF